MNLQDRICKLKKHTVRLVAYICGLILLSTTISGCAAREPVAVTRTGLYFDTVITITLYDERSEALIEECFNMAKEYEQLFSTTIESSDVSRINSANGEWVDVDARTVEIIERGLEYGAMSDGRFSICCGAVTSLWDFGTEALSDDSAADRIPDEAAITEALNHVGDELLEYDGKEFRVRLKDPMARIDLGAIAKGYIADSMKAYLLSEGVNEGVINLGGNVLLLGPKSFGDGTYRIGIQKPFGKDGEMLQDVVATDKSIVTSGSYQRYFYKDDKIYHHIINLHTGYPAWTGLSAVTIISDNSCQGDALSTICFLLGKDAGQKLCDELGVEAVFVEDENAIYDLEVKKETVQDIRANTEMDENPWSINLIMVGDVLLHDRIEENSVDENGVYNYDSLFQNTKERIESADLAIVNQEVIIGGEELRITGYPAFNAPYELADALVDAGFDIICQGTNHALDRGKAGIVNCDSYWEEKFPDIVVLGIHNDEEEKPYYIYEVGGKKIAFFNYTYGTNGIALPNDMPYAVDILDEQKVIADLKEVEEKADFTIVFPHWGTEYNLSTDSMQKKWAKIFIENGVDLVIGTHPHVIESVEMLEDEQGNKMLVYYSLGNYVNWTSGTGAGTANRMLGMMADVTLGEDEQGQIVITDYNAIPLVAHVEKGFGKVTTYFLSDYTEELAESNAIKQQDSTFSLDYIQNLFLDIE